MRGSPWNQKTGRREMLHGPRRHQQPGGQRKTDLENPPRFLDRERGQMLTRRRRGPSRRERSGTRSAARRADRREQNAASTLWKPSIPFRQTSTMQRSQRPAIQSLRRRRSSCGRGPEPLRKPRRPPLGPPERRRRSAGSAPFSLLLPLLLPLPPLPLEVREFPLSERR